MRLSDMTGRWIFKGLVALVAVTPLAAQDAGQLIERARIAATLQNNDLRGEISKKGGNKTDIFLFLRGKDIQFRFSENGGPWQGFHMRLGDGKYNLSSVVDGKHVAFPDSRLSQPIAGTDLTYEDLSMRFFYWPKPTLEGEERVNTHDCWKIRLNNPGRAGDYSVVYVWVHKKYGAFMKIEGFDRTGKRLKRFEVDSVMQLSDGSYTLKEMDVSSMNGDRATGHTTVKFDKPAAPKPGGPR